MNVTDPIRTQKEVQSIKNFYLEKGALRNHVLINFGLHTALRIGDILSLKWSDVYNFKLKKFHEHLILVEQKTDKLTKIALHGNLIKAMEGYFNENKKKITPDSFIFRNRKTNNAITRVQAYRIIKTAAKSLNIEGSIGCHSLRKTFGYNAWKNGTPPAMLMQLFNHSSFEITRRYSCINQEDMDEVFKNINY